MENLDILNNPHVDRLRRHLPFGADSGELYEELAEGDGSFSFETKAYRHVLRLLDKPEISLVVLTGDAGHGKTHLCRRILEKSRKIAPERSMEMLEKDRTGETLLTSDAMPDARPLRIIKDLSELDIDQAAERLGDLLADETSLAIVCANEGRLREVVSRDRPTLGGLLEALEGSIQEGRTSVDRRVEVVNLNFQSVTAAEGHGSFLMELIKNWTDGRRWTICKRCDAATLCPILRNRREFSSSGEEEKACETRRSGIEALVRIVEQSGYVLTIRECLMFVAYLLTGGLDCSDVARAAKEKQGLERLYTAGYFPTLLFEKQLETSDLRQMRIIERLRRIDPGLSAVREIDDEIVKLLDIVDTMDGDSRFRPPPRTTSDRHKEASVHTEQVRTRRRLEFFSLEACTESNRHISRVRRLGLRFYDDFCHVIRVADPEDLELVRIRDQLISGLHVLQGIRPRRDGSAFFLVDPAFGQGIGGASIIARDIPRRKVRLMGEAKWWRILQEGRDPELTGAVDWLDRRVVVDFGDHGGPLLRLDLFAFESTMRAGIGVGFRDFFRPEIRRILSRLAFLAEGGQMDEDRILVMIGPERQEINIDVGNIVRVGGY